MMNYKRLIFSLCLLTNNLLAFQDEDMDGVDDSVDLCLNTPFDVLVNKEGCPKEGEEDNYLGRLTLKVGEDINRDKNYENSNTLSLYANYRYDNWDMAISNYQSTNQNNEENLNSDNIYLSTGYLFNFSKSSLKFTIGTKINNSDTTALENNRQRRNLQNQNQHQNQQTALNSPKNDYFSSLNLNYFLSSKQDVSLYYGYTLNGNRQKTNSENFSSLSLGTGYAFNKKWYSNLSYNYTESIYKNAKASQNLSWFNSYNFDHNIFATASYRYALDNDSYDHIFSLGLGIYFE